MTRALPSLPRPSLAARALLALVRGYQLLLSPLLGGHCRFEPSCSRYAAACLETQGAWRGSLLSILRLCKCHPFHPGGIDLPPPRSSTPCSAAPLPASPPSASSASPPSGPSAPTRSTQAHLPS